MVVVGFFSLGKINHQSKAALAACLGVGFGIGEIIFLARVYALESQALSLPWYMFGGFVGERLMVCCIHSALMLIMADALCDKKLWRVLLAPFLHWSLNLPVFLSHWYPIEATGMVWQQILWVWEIIFLGGAFFYLLPHLLSGAERVAWFLGKATCPECKTLYVRPMWGVNRLEGQRYERCPQCKQWHWTTLYVEERTQ